MNTYFMSDHYRMTGESLPKKLRVWCDIALRHNIRYMYFFRIAQHRKSLIAKLVLSWMSTKYGLEISTAASIGPGLYLGHPYNITVAQDTVIGKNVNLHKGCTIGRENRGRRMGAPTLGDDVFVGINATIVGKIHIGSDVVIAPNSYVNFDIPDYSIVIGNPGVIRHKENATADYINFCV